MMVLAVESSGTVAAVAVANEDKLVGEFFLDHRRTHSQQLLPLLEGLLNSLDMELGDMDIFAASNGPGSFTGLRIGIATVKALGQALNKPVVGVPTLDGLAYNLISREGLICPIMDARREQVYTSIYRSGSSAHSIRAGLERLDEYMALPVASLIEKLKAYNEPVLFNGDGVIPYWEIIKEEMGEKAHRSPISHMMQRASSIACLALEMAHSGLTQNYMELVPFYLRKSQAEQRFGQRG